ncbi:MAG: citryl-CoA lyase, partial [Candidatus Diapherotrites archaeon]|nr:citryl-CoA lyase [Candidatus Diapherotrites archaeon]
LEAELEKSLGKKLCLNVDGCIGALISEMGFDWRLGKGFFIIGRIPGLVAHVHEEWVREKPFRRLQDEDHTFDGTAPRKLT